MLLKKARHTNHGLVFDNFEQKSMMGANRVVSSLEKIVKVKQTIIRRIILHCDVEHQGTDATLRK